MEELVKKAKNGNVEAFSELIIAVEDNLYRIARIRLKADEDIYDAVQETIIKAFESIKQLKDAKYFKTWIIRILINETNRIYVKKNKEKLVPFEEIENSKSHNSSNIEDLEQILDFDFICKKLKYEERVIIILYYMEKYTDKEIGKILNLKEDTVYTKRRRAKEKIKTFLKIGGKIDG